MRDEFKSIKEVSTGDFRDRGSKFLAFAYPVLSEEQAKEHIDELWKLHPKARHVCFAYVLGPETGIFRSNDDGEPSGSAGLPILNVIKSFELEHVLVAVVRYFGGTKLGVPGLINAYKMSSLEALTGANIITRYLSDQIKVTFGYEIMGPLMSVLKKIEIPIISKSFDANPYLILETRKSKTGEMLVQVKAQLLGKTMEEVNEHTMVPSCDFKILEHA